jgi:hypothetical protein
MVLSGKAQAAPSGLGYTDLPAASEYAYPPQSNGLLLTGDTVCIKCSLGSVGLPAGTFTVSPELPFGLSLNVQTGDIIGTPSSDTSRQDYRVILQNPAGKSECTISLEVQTHRPPGPLEYNAALHTDKKMYVIFKIGQSIVPIVPTKVDSKNNLILRVSPELPAGLSLDPRTGVLSGAPEVPLSKTHFTVTARNMSGSQSTKIVLSVAGDWQHADPSEWTIEMTQMWLKNELNCNEDDKSHFLAIDGRQLIQLQSKEAVASKLPSVHGTLQVLIPEKVKALVDKWDQTSQQATPSKSPAWVEAGDKAEQSVQPKNWNSMDVELQAKEEEERAGTQLKVFFPGGGAGGNAGGNAKKKPKPKAKPRTIRQPLAPLEEEEEEVPELNRGRMWRWLRC